MTILSKIIWEVKTQTWAQVAGSVDDILTFVRAEWKIRKRERGGKAPQRPDALLSVLWKTNANLTAQKCNMHNLFISFLHSVL